MLLWRVVECLSLVACHLNWPLVRLWFCAGQMVQAKQPCYARLLVCSPCFQALSEAGTDAVAYAGHADGLKAMLSVSENLTFWAAVYGMRDIKPALDAYSLAKLADRLTGTLSAGQKRRAGLARLMVTGRPIWVLDEPTVSLDADAVALFADAVRGHLRAGGMALLATHIELGLDAQVLDVTPLRARAQALHGASDEAFL